MKTRITDLFGIQYPIIQGAMQWLSKPKLAAAVSNAGGLGTINMTTYDTPEAFQQDIQLLKTLTDKPFCVNLSLLPDTKPDGPHQGLSPGHHRGKGPHCGDRRQLPQAVYGHLEGGRAAWSCTRFPTPVSPTPPRRWAATRCVRGV